MSYQYLFSVLQNYSMSQALTLGHYLGVYKQIMNQKRQQESWREREMDRDIDKVWKIGL